MNAFILRLLHALGLTDLTDSEVDAYLSYRNLIKSAPSLSTQPSGLVASHKELSDLAARHSTSSLFSDSHSPHSMPLIPSSYDSSDSQNSTDRFVRSLDSLMRTLVNPGIDQPNSRCILITSAVGSEGKSTLAMHLADRWAKAGLKTILVEADLRRPSLTRRLELDGSPGLAEVLEGGIAPETAMVRVGDKKGFLFLPAGVLTQDPIRLLRGDRFGQIIARFRESFDMIIIDSPPVLPVPDALILGRWSDGTILAVRHDSTRLPLVEKANSQLASAGITVLGVVVNPVKAPMSKYGYYRIDEASESVQDRFNSPFLNNRNSEY